MTPRYILIVLTTILLIGCRPSSPQIPSQRKGQAVAVDSAALALLELNQQLAETADQQLAKIVAQQPESYASYEGNVWATILQQGDTDLELPQTGKPCTLHMQIYDLKGKLLLDSEGTYRIGKKELPTAIDSNITEWYRGSRIRLYAPWYSAYGLQGTDHIPPYENIRIDLEIR